MSIFSINLLNKTNVTYSKLNLTQVLMIYSLRIFSSFLVIILLKPYQYITISQVPQNVLNDYVYKN
jgi:hypothetical protein